MSDLNLNTIHQFGTLISKKIFIYWNLFKKISILMCLFVVIYLLLLMLIVSKSLVLNLWNIVD